MKACPNCGKEVTDLDSICPNCGFDLQKYRSEFFAKNSSDHHKEHSTTSRRAAYREEFKPIKQNSTVQKMIAWVRANATIVYLLGVLLLVIMSFSRSLGWISFLVLMVCLYIVCDRAEKIEQYTSDRRLTEKINQWGSDTFNSIEDHGEKLKSRRKNFEEKHPRVEGEVAEVKRKRRIHFSYIQLSVILTVLLA